MKTTEWGVLHRIAQDASEHFFLRLRVTETPGDVSRQTIKEALERAGRTYSEGPYLWGNHSLVPQEQWPDGVREDYTADGVDSLPYADLLDESKGEKRVTLRLPIGLHGILVKAAGEKSFNQFCMDALSAAVGYGEALPDYIPLLAQQSGLTEAEMREKVVGAHAHTAERASHSEELAAKSRKMQAYFQAVGRLPAEKVAQLSRAAITPALIDSINAAASELDRMTPEQFEEVAKMSGVTVEALRASNGAMQAAFGIGYERVQAMMDVPPEVVKANCQYLGDAFSPPEE